MEICNLIEEDNREFHSSKTNPFMNLLYKYNLVGNKHIPKEYMLNSREIRLKLLAGLIDSDGNVTNDSKRVSIGQVNKSLAGQISILAHSLGFIVNERTEERKNVKCPGAERRDYQDQYLVNISGSTLSEIPTLLPRKKCENSNTNKDYKKTAITVKSIGTGMYYGFQVDDNNHFVANDFTVLKNCDQMYCVECHTFFSWNTLKIQTSGSMHNPHYFEYRARENGGNAPRTPGDVLCGRTLDRRLANSLMKFGKVYMDMVQPLSHIRGNIIPVKFRAVDIIERNASDRVLYIIKEKTMEQFKRDIQKREKANSKTQEIRNILNLFVDVTTDNLYKLLQDKSKEEFNEASRSLLEYCNSELSIVAKTYKCICYRIDKNFQLKSGSTFKDSYL
jgi:hypothetical protein